MYTDCVTSPSSYRCYCDLRTERIRTIYKGMEDEQKGGGGGCTGLQVDNIEKDSMGTFQMVKQFGGDR